MKVKSIKKSLTALVLGGIILSNSAVAMAAKKSLSGGTLYYGVTLSECYSNYFHAGKEHRSTAINGKGDSCVSKWVSVDKTSYASVKRTLTGNESFGKTR